MRLIAKGSSTATLKPGNILITRQGVKVLDFGLADIAGDPALTKTGAVMGTPAYMAPDMGRQARCALGYLRLRLCVSRDADRQARIAKRDGG